MGGTNSSMWYTNFGFSIFKIVVFNFRLFWKFLISSPSALTTESHYNSDCCTRLAWQPQFLCCFQKAAAGPLCVCISMCICKCVFLWQFYWNVIHTAYNLPFKVYDSFFLVYSQHIVQLSPLSNYRTFSSP